ncbi:hypothetical protein HPB50_004605 [Hyalomma asiaticum]|uniref:Uncharacterized protein n=1 Tax=Hyalomma asiaticum TaxID=266040 RepID=A0ACB7TCQ0_HYAAI|nr:hypothetical protein HPB50_004605 [Hyalomma asiaticum]
MCVHSVWSQSTFSPVQTRHFLDALRTSTYAASKYPPVHPIVSQRTCIRLHTIIAFADAQGIHIEPNASPFFFSAGFACSVDRRVPVVSEARRGFLQLLIHRSFYSPQPALQRPKPLRQADDETTEQLAMEEPFVPGPARQLNKSSLSRRAERFASDPENAASFKHVPTWDPRRKNENRDDDDETHPKQRWKNTIWRRILQRAARPFPFCPCARFSLAAAALTQTTYNLEIRFVPLLMA